MPALQRLEQVDQEFEVRLRYKKERKKEVPSILDNSGEIFYHGTYL